MPRIDRRAIPRRWTRAFQAAALSAGAILAAGAAPAQDKSQPPPAPPAEQPVKPEPQPPAPPPVAEVVPPAGFTALFNGKDLTNWKGLVEDPPKRAAMPPAELAAKQQLADQRMREHWRAENGVLLYDGKGDSLCTAEDFASVELLVDWKIEPGGDSGIYLRGSPQVNIWDNPEGSGGLYNNEKNPRRVLVKADKPPGEWNTFRIFMVGDRVTVYLNGVLVVDDTVLENYWERDKPIYPAGPIELQNHGVPLAFRNIFVRRLDAPARPTQPVLKDSDRVAIIGDSITEQRLYSRFIETYLLACVPQKDVRCMQFGWSGERAPGFLQRLANDVLPWKPTVATLCYGMNDGLYRAYEPVTGDVFREAVSGIVKAFKDSGARVVIGSPGAVDFVSFKNLPPNVYNDTLGKLRDLSRELAWRESTPFANVHDPMILAQLRARPVLGDAYHVCGPDGFHPAANGHAVMAYAFLKALGVTGDIGLITFDLNGGATASDGHKVVAAEKGTVKIESTRYPYCFPPGEPNNPDAARSVLPFVPFQQDLNRFTLRCTGLAAPRATVFWNDASRTFTKEQLEAGINLAAEFLDNPFSEAFAKLDAAVAAKQEFETVVIKGAVTHFRTARELLKDDKEGSSALDTAAARLRAQQEERSAAVRALVTPVTHSIRVEPVTEPPKP